VERRTGEGVEALDVRNVRMVEHPGRCDHRLEPVLVTRGGPQRPGAIDELEVDDLVAEADPWCDPWSSATRSR
jgi:hypothetical protein